MSSAAEGASSAGAAEAAGRAGYDSGYDPSGSPRQAAGYETAAGNRRGQQPSAAGVGFTLAAGVLMILSGLWSFLEGLAAVIKKQFFVVTPNYTFQWNLSGWGWTHLILGIVVFAAGVCVLLGMTWARVVGVILAVFSAIASFMFLPYYPVWSIVVIAIDVFIIWALMTTRLREAV
jgi:hypothetical protein